MNNTQLQPQASKFQIQLVKSPVNAQNTQLSTIQYVSDQDQLNEVIKLAGHPGALLVAAAFAAYLIMMGVCQIIRTVKDKSGKSK